jgi:hypothetical protein
MPETHLRPAAASGGRQYSVFTQPDRTMETHSGYSGIDSTTILLGEIPQAVQAPLVSCRVARRSMTLSDRTDHLTALSMRRSTCQFVAPPSLYIAEQQKSTKPGSRKVSLLVDLDVLTSDRRCTHLDNCCCCTATTCRTPHPVVLGTHLNILLTR